MFVAFALLCPLDDESIDNDDTLLVADIIDAFGGVMSRPSELCREKLYYIEYQQISSNSHCIHRFEAILVRNSHT